MAKQIVTGFAPPSQAALEERVHHLEIQVAALTETVGVLVARLEGDDAPGSTEPIKKGRKVMVRDNG